MTEAQARRLTKYFTEGVRAEIWCYGKPVEWALIVERDGTARFYGIDSLKRRVLFLRERIASGSTDLRLISETYEHSEDEIEFTNQEEAMDCIGAIRQAVEHIQAYGSDPDWFEVSSDVFGQPAFPTPPHPSANPGQQIVER